MEKINNSPSPENGGQKPELFNKREQVLVDLAREADKLLQELGSRYDNKKIFKRAIESAKKADNPDDEFEHVYFPDTAEPRVEQDLIKEWTEIVELDKTGDNTDGIEFQYRRDSMWQGMEDLVKILRKMQSQTPEEIAFDNQVEERDQQQYEKLVESYKNACEGFEKAGWKLFEGFTRKANEPEGTEITIAKPVVGFYEENHPLGTKYYMTAGDVQAPDGIYTEKWIFKVTNGAWLASKCETVWEDGTKHEIDYAKNESDHFHDTRGMYLPNEFDEMMKATGDNKWPPEKK